MYRLRSTTQAVLSSFFAEMIAERFSPSRVRGRRTQRALDGSAPLCTPSPLRRKKEKKMYLTTTGLLMEGDFTH